MRMRYGTMLLTGLFVFMGLVNTGRAQHEQDKPSTARFGDPSSTARTLQDYLYGVIKKIDSKEVVLTKTKYGLDQTVLLEPKTKYIHDGKPSTIGRLKVGEQVWVDVKQEKKSGEMIAKKVVTGVAFTEAR